MAKNTEQVCLCDDDAELFKSACKKYKMKKSALLNKIVSGWLFDNKISLIEK